MDYVHLCVFGLNVCEHSLPLVVSERDPLRRHLEVNHGGRWRGVLGERQRGRLLNRLVSRQRLQLHRAQVPHVTRYTVHHKTKTKVTYWWYSNRTTLFCVFCILK